MCIYTMIAEKVNACILPSGEFNDNVYDELFIENPLDFKKFDFKVLSEKLDDKVEWIAKNNNCIFIYKGIYFAFYEFGKSKTTIMIVAAEDEKDIYTCLE